MKLPIVSLLASTLVLASCASMIDYAMTSSPSAKAAAIIEAKLQKDVETCQFLDNVSGSSMLGANEDGGAISMNNAMVEAKEKAAKLGATHMLFLNKRGAISSLDEVTDIRNFEGGGSKVSAKAYKCKKS